MPTIDQLAAAVVAADTDELPVWQGGTVRRVTRAQLLAGTQTGLAVAPGTLLGRSSAGFGAPETIGVGGALTLEAGTLSAPAPFTTAALPAGRAPTASDLLPVGQAGADRAVAFGTLMNGLSGLAGIDLSHHLVQPTGGSAPRTLADSLADPVAIEAFGAVADGVTDCGAAIIAAVAAGRPIRFGPGAYALHGQCTIAQAAILIGTPGLTTLSRPPSSVQAGGAWISIQGPSFNASGIVFDAGHHPAESWGVLVTEACGQARFADCVFANATGPSLGCGLTLLPNPAAGHAVMRCEARGNGLHGIWLRASTGARIVDCSAHDNAGYGICVDDDDPALVRRIQGALVRGNVCWANQRGISVGNFNKTNAQPPVWGNANPDVIGAVVSHNYCHDNTAYGIALAGQALVAGHNLLTGNGPNGAGILFNASHSRLGDNVVVALPGSFGIDAGGCADCDIVANQVSGAAVGINGGGVQRVGITGNRLDGNVWGITAYNVETDGADGNFGQATAALTIACNSITIPAASGGGISLIDGPQSVAVTGNAFFGQGGADIAQCLWANTDGAVVHGNRWNNEARRIVNPSVIGGLNQIVLPDIADDIMVTATPNGVQSITTAHAASLAGQIAFVRLTAAGAGYSTASVAILGTGTGATAIAYVSGGAVIGIAVTNPGSGYSQGATAVIRGDGQGATATASVGLAPLEVRRLRIQCNAATRFDRAAGTPPLDNWTQAAVTVPAGAAIDWTVTWGAWRATAFTAA